MQTAVAPVPVPPATPDSASQAAKKVRKVRFNPYVHKLMLPLEEADDAQLARKSMIKEAPYNDELWDGDESDFREKELSPDELWTLRLREKVGVLPKKWTHPLKSGIKALFHSLAGPKQQQGGGGQLDIDAVYSHARKTAPAEQVVGETAADLVAFAKEKPIRRIGLKRQSSSMSRKPSELVLSEFTGAKADKVFARFDALQHQISTLRTAPEQLLAQERVLVAQLMELDKVKTDLQNLRFDIPDLERKIDRHASQSRFYSLYAAEKTKQLQQDLRKLRSDQKHALARLSQLGGEIFNTNKQVERLGEQLVSLRACEAELFDIETFVVNRHLKMPDLAMETAMEALDELKRQLEREEHTKARLRLACETTLPSQVVADLDQAQASLVLADQLLQAIFAKHQANPNSPMYVNNAHLAAVDRVFDPKSPVPSVVDDVVLLTIRRREALNRMRDAALRSVSTLNHTLDDLEESIGHANWSESVLKWRQEVPNMSAPELFGLATKKSPLQEEIHAESFGKFKDKTKKRLAALQAARELAQRYVGFFQREVLRCKHRLDKLTQQKEVLKAELVAKRKEVFENARRFGDFGGGTGGEEEEEDAALPVRSRSFDDSSRVSSSAAVGLGGRDRGVSMDISVLTSSSAAAAAGGVVNDDDLRRA